MGEMDNETTAQVNRRSRANRLDDVFTTTKLIPTITGFRVEPSGDVPPHGPVQLRLRPEQITQAKTTARKTTSVADASNEQMRNATQDKSAAEAKHTRDGIHEEIAQSHG